MKKSAAVHGDGDRVDIAGRYARRLWRALAVGAVLLVAASAFGAGSAGLAQGGGKAAGADIVIAQNDTQLVIVQFGPGSRENETRRILAALDGLPHRIVAQFEVTPAISLEVNAAGLAALEALPGVTVTIDTPVPPQ
jgi:hypothetical protein